MSEQIVTVEMLIKPDQRWHHLIFVIDGWRVTAYIDGVMDTAHVDFTALYEHALTPERIAAHATEFLNGVNE